MDCLRSRTARLFAVVAVIAAVFSFSCKMESDDDDDSGGVTGVVTGVTISGSSIIEATGNATLTATPTYTGTPTITYTWSITSGSSYASLPATTSGTTLTSIVLTGANTTSSAQTVTVQVSASDGTNTKTSTQSISIAAVGVTVSNEVTSVSINGTSSSITAEGTTTLTATSVYNGSPTITYTWSITSGGDYASLPATTSGTALTSIVLTGTNTTSSAQTVTVQVSASDGTNTVTDTYDVTVAKSSTVALYPLSGATDAFADTQLILSFTSTPTLASRGSIYIYTSGGTLTDTISVNSTSANESQSCQSGYTVNVGNKQLVRVSGKKVYIQPHYGVLSNGTSYYVLIADGVISGTLYGESSAFAGFTTTTDWTFTTGSAPSISTSSAITVSNATSDNTAKFFSVYGAMKAAAAKSSGTYTIDIAAGTYYELISIKSSGANIILHGPDSNDRGDTCVIEYINNNYMATVGASYTSMAQRVSFYYAGANLTLENVTLANLTERSTSYTYDGENGSGSYQAETLMFASGSGKELAAYNCSFKSHQDTLYTTGKAWFYDCYVEGDVDYIWGTSDVTLLENCDLDCLYDGASTAYIFETRVGSTSGTTVGKGYVLFNTDVTIESGTTAYYGRRASAKTSTSYYDQAALVNVDFIANGTLSSAHWYIGNEPEGLTSTLYGNYADVGWKEYNVTSGNSAVGTGSRVSAAGDITSTEYTAEYSGRRAILNRVYNKTDNAYERDTSTNFGVDSLISDMGWDVDADTSSELASGETSATTIIYDFRESSAVSTTYSPTTGTADDLTSISGFTYKDTAYGWYTSSTPATMTVPVTGACTLKIYNSYQKSNSSGDTISVETDSGDSVGTVTASYGDYKSSPEELSVSYTSTAADNLVISYPAKNIYIAKVEVVYAGTSSLSLTISGDTSVAAGSSITLTATPSTTTSSTDYSWYFSTGTTSAYATVDVATATTSSCTATLTGVAAGSVNVYCAVDGVVSSSYAVTVTAAGETTLSLTDSPTGYASEGSPSYNQSTSKTITVSTASTLKSYASQGGYVIYISSMIDMTEGMLPSSYDNDDSELGTFISENYGNYSGDAITSWSAWRKAYAAYNTTTSEYDSSTASSATDLDGYQYALVAAWKSQIQIVVASNTTIIGTTASAGIKGGTFSISGSSSSSPAKNIIIRNLTIQDAFDPFPHHESGDGWNAEYDGITIQGYTEHIWIDHCTFQDTISVGWTDFAGVTTGSSNDAVAYDLSNSDLEMWQTYDGLCDIKGSAQYITVSNCKFYNHDKTMLIGSSDTEKLSGTSTYVTHTDRTVTLHHNYFSNCVQRLPMVRLTDIHIYNNYFDFDTSCGYDQKAAVNIRKNAYVNSEYNYFASGMKYSYNGPSSSGGYLYYYGDSDNSTSLTSLGSTDASTSTKVFTIPYTYTPDSTSTVVSDVPTNAGAGYTVE